MLLVSLFFFTGCSEHETSLSDKARSEIDYFGAKFIDILNRLNNITFENYHVTAEQVELSRETAENEKSSESSSSQNNSDSPADVQGSNKNNTIISLQMSPNTILNPTTGEIDWAGIKNEVENLYYSWNTVLIDLYELKVPNDDILGFSSSLDLATSYIKDENKSNSILAMANLYKFIPKYAEIISNEQAYINILKTKSFILNAYSLVEAGDWKTVTIEIDKALEVFKFVSSDVSFVSENSYRVNKVYVLLNELKNSLNLEDKDIFYIKYRNLMEEIVEL